MWDVEFLEEDNQVIDIVSARSQICFLSYDEHTRRDSQLTSQSQKVSQATKRKRVIPSLPSQERSAKERFVSPLHDECGVDQESALGLHHGR
jgi:hypothetical protein